MSMLFVANKIGHETTVYDLYRQHYYEEYIEEEMQHPLNFHVHSFADYEYFNPIIEFDDKLSLVVASYCVHCSLENMEAVDKFIDYIYGLMKKHFGEQYVTRPELDNDWVPIYQDADGNEYNPWDDDLECDEDYKDYHWYVIKHGKKVPLERVPDEWCRAYNFGNAAERLYGTVQEFIRQEGITIEDFLFNTKYFAIVDNPEGMPGINDMLKVGLLHTEDWEDSLRIN